MLAASLAVASGEAPAPDLSLPDMSGNPQSLRQYRGRIVVLNFWATWCEPCREEMPMLVEAQKLYAERGLAVIGASLDDAGTQSKIAPFIRKRKINFPIWVGATPEDLKKFGLGEALPATVFLDRDGRIVARVLGQLRKRHLTERVEWLLGNQQGEPPQPLVNNLGH